MQILITIALIIIGVLLFELIIFSHEFGHFITAKLSGVKVNEFALGMGPRLFGFTKGETTYSFRLFPIGGYCAMEGEDEDSNEPRSFNNAKIWKRMIIIIAGAVMNIILGFILMFVLTAQADSFESTTIQKFPPASFSANSGLQAGDKIVDINGYSIWNSQDLKFAISTLKCSEVDGHSLTVYKEDCACNLRNLYVSLYNDKKPSDQQLTEMYEMLIDSSAKIAMADTKELAYKYYVEAYEDLNNYLSVKDYDVLEINEQDLRKRFTADVTVVRNGTNVKLNDVQFFTAKNEKDPDAPTVSIDFYVEGIEKNFGTIIGETFSTTCSMVKTVWTSLVWIVQGRFSFTDMSGPVGIATAVTQVASQGLEVGFMSAVNNILFVMILITVNLGIVNMLPFPALDGGRFLFLLIEGIFRKPIPRNVEKYVNAAGLIILLLFTLIISLKDVWQLITHSFPGM